MDGSTSLATGGSTEPALSAVEGLALKRITIFLRKNECTTEHLFRVVAGIGVAVAIVRLFYRKIPGSTTPLSAAQLE